MTCVSKTYLEWYKAAKQVFQIGFGAMSELVDAGTTLDPDGVPTVELHKLISERPEEWEDISSTVTISDTVVVDDAENEMVDGAVQFTLGVDGDDDPESGDIYSFFVMADRDDDNTLQATARVWLRIMP